MGVLLERRVRIHWGEVGTKYSQKGALIRPDSRWLIETLCFHFWNAPLSSLYLVKTCSTFGHIFRFLNLRLNHPNLPYQPSEMTFSCSFLYHLFLHCVTRSYPDSSLPIYPHSHPRQFLCFFSGTSPGSISKTFSFFRLHHRFISGSLPLSAVPVNRIRPPREGVPISTTPNLPCATQALRSSPICDLYSQISSCSYSFRPQKFVRHSYFLPSIHTRFSRDTSKHLESLEIHNNAQSSSPVLFLVLGSSLPLAIGEALLIA